MLDIYPAFILLFAVFIFLSPIMLKRIRAKLKYIRLNRINRQISQLYKDVNPYQISIQARKDLGMEDKNLVYGEVNIITFLEILNDLSPAPDAIFYDLGSGCGKQVIAASLAFPLRKIVGVELLAELHEISLKKLSQLNPSVQNVSFIKQDYFKTDISDADIILINATCIDTENWQKLTEKLIETKAKCKLCVITKRIKHEDFKLISQNMELMSWGYATVRLYEKR